MKILDIIVHEIETESGSSDVLVNPREKALDPSDKNVIHLMELINDAYGSAKSLDYGKFVDTLNFPKLLSQYQSGQKSFYDLSLEAMDELKSRMQTQRLSTGGYIVLSRFDSSESTKFFMAVMLKIKEGLVFDEDMELLEVERLDLEQLHFAARINLSLQSSKPDKRYVSFLKGKRSQEDISKYFRAFLGVDETSYESAKGATTTLIDSIKYYAANKKWTEEEYSAVKSRVFAYAKTQFENSNSVNISALSSLIDPESADDFVKHANKHELPATFHIDSKVLNRLRRYSGGDKEVNISFTNDAIDKRIFIDHKKDTITLKGIPQRLKQDLLENG
jgi:nucleoid-associated protein